MTEHKVLDLFENINETYYLESLGFNVNVPVYRNFTHLYAKIFFSILNKFNLDYYVFAGTSIGYFRNMKNIPWVDDYDIIIFEDEMDKFKNIVVPELIKYGFRCFNPTHTVIECGHHVLSKFGQKYFQCDIFYTKVDDNNIIKNLNKWGLYNCKNININIVKPKQYLTIDGDLTLPFFNDFKEDIKLEYGDVINNCVFHVNHCSTNKITKHFKLVYDDFNLIKQTIIDNTNKLFNNHEYINNKTLNNYNLFFTNNKSNLFDKTIFFLKYINNEKIKNLYITDENFLLFCVDVKFYFKDINIYFYINKELENKNIILLNYVNTVYCLNSIYIEYLNNLNVYFLNKPIIEITKVITFGTYDLFHIGHVNILKRAKEYGELVVGVSTDELNNKKNKISINNLEQRKLDVYNTNYANIIFDEESLELKNDYVKKYNCNLLIMGDDWIDAFNFCDCACLYLPRTPNISTTMLKKELQQSITVIN